jgi:hypothetical protein
MGWFFNSSNLGLQIEVKDLLASLGVMGGQHVESPSHC